MNRSRTVLFTLIILVITPAAVAEIYKCDGPDGPVYSDKKCGSDAANVELQESSGLSGVSEQDKSDLAEKKLEREQARSRNQQGNSVNNQNNDYSTEDPGYWVRDGDRLRNLDKEKILPGKTPPAKPRPVTLPAKTPKKRKNG